jgi:N-methylhydantoinase A/oxoprolinase/acetone carboxylase beta subunit
MTRIGIDVGGTFTDVILRAGDGRAAIRKLLSTPPEYDRAAVAAVNDLVQSDRASASAVAEIVHGTTVATNAVVERRGSITALVTTAGFRDVLELRRLRIPHMYDLFWRKPPALIPRRLRFELHERVTAEGRILRALDDDEARALAAGLRRYGVESVAVCFLHSYLYPDHERRFRAILQEELPRAIVSLSSDILREQREYERSATTAVNAYVRPVMASYVDRIRTGLDALGVSAPLTIMQSSGGVMTSEDAKLRPVFALESGPAAGVIAALGLALELGQRNVIAFDMGGTTAKASLIENGEVSRGREYEVGGSLSAGSRLIRGSGELLRIPTIEIAEVGAGGGSIAWLDPAGGLQVGPRSAGADPGPACYGRGGREPTVTDANVALGYIPSGQVADGQITISAELAEQSVLTVARPLGLSLLDAAHGIHRVANARMTRALRAVSSEKGRDPREFALLAYGGSGPVHAVGLADELGISTVLVPPLAGLFSAIGLLFARREFHEVRTCQLDARGANPAVVSELFAEMQESLVGAAGDLEAVEWSRSGDLRYGGQSWEVEVELPAGPIDGSSLGALLDRFEAEHERLYGVRGLPGSPVEIRALRLAAVGPARTTGPIRLENGSMSSDLADVRLPYFGGSSQAASVCRRASVPITPKPGPLLVDEYDTTVVVPPGWSARRDPHTETLVLERIAG